MAKLYFSRNDDERCYPVDYWKDYLIKNELNKIDLFEAKIDTGSGHFFCKIHQEVGDTNEGSCGKIYDHYQPRNGKNGRCRYSGNCYEITDIKFTVTIYLLIPK